MPRWHDGRAKEGRREGRWKVLFGRWKGDGIVIVAAPTYACVSTAASLPYSIRLAYSRESGDACLAVIGTCRRTELRRNCYAKPGDVLILTKGVGIYLAAFKKGAFTADASSLSHRRRC
jgi:hypothetical protein